VATDEQFPDGRAKIIAAAQAAASWARARRATWTDVPLAIPREVTTVVEAAPIVEHIPEPAVDAGPGFAERLSQWAAAVREPAVRWLPRIGVAAALIAAMVYGGPYAYKTLVSLKPYLQFAPTSSTETPPPVPVEKPAPVRPVGTLRVKSAPPGARVLLDGTPRGTTPTTIEEVPAGRHSVVLEGSAGMIERTVAITPGAVVDVDESIFSGFVTVFSPFELTITEGRQAMRLDEHNEFMLPPGRHELRLTNRSLGFEETRRVDLKPGQRVTISIAPPKSTISVTANEEADVFSDGTRIGSVPLTEFPIELGTHEIVVRRSAGGERRFTVTVTVRPLTLDVDFSKPQD
jgi:hypothetical protein